MVDFINADTSTWASCVPYLFTFLYTGFNLTAVEWIMHLIVVLPHLARALPEMVLTTRGSRISPGDRLLLRVFLSIAEGSFT